MRLEGFHLQKLVILDHLTMFINFDYFIQLLGIELIHVYHLDVRQGLKADQSGLNWLGNHILSWC